MGGRREEGGGRRGGVGAGMLQRCSFPRPASGFDPSPPSLPPTPTRRCRRHPSASRWAPLIPCTGNRRALDVRSFQEGIIIFSSHSIRRSSAVPSRSLACPGVCRTCEAISRRKKKTWFSFFSCEFSCSGSGGRCQRP